MYSVTCHNEADVIRELRKDADKICRLYRHQTHRYGGYNVAYQVTVV